MNRNDILNIYTKLKKDVDVLIDIYISSYPIRPNTREWNEGRVSGALDVLYCFVCFSLSQYNIDIFNLFYEYEYEVHSVLYGKLKQ